MDDFNSYVRNGGKNGSNNFGSGNSESGKGVPNNIMNLVGALSNKYDGKSQAELIKAIYDEAKKGKEQGTLSNADIDNFVSMLSPMLDSQKRKVLNRIADELKKI